MNKHISQESLYALLRVLAPYALEALKTSVGPAQLKRDIEEAQSLGPRDNERLFTLLDNIHQGALALVRDLPASRIIEQAMLAVSNRQEDRELPLEVLHKILQGQQALLDGQSTLLTRTAPAHDINAAIGEMPGKVSTVPGIKKVQTASALLRRQEQAKACVADHYAHWVQQWPHLFVETTPARESQIRDLDMSLNEQGARGRRLNLHWTTDYDRHYTKDPCLPRPFWKNGINFAQSRDKDHVAWWCSLPHKIKFQILLTLPFEDATLT